MKNKLVELKRKIFNREDVREDVDELLADFLSKPTLEEITLLQGLVDLTDDEELINKVRRITNLVKFPLKKMI